MASAVDSRLAYARLSAVATASRLPTANRGSNNSYTTSWDTTARDALFAIATASCNRRHHASSTGRIWKTPREHAVVATRPDLKLASEDRKNHHGAS